MSELKEVRDLQIGDVCGEPWLDEVVVLSEPEYMKGNASYCFAVGPRNGTWVETAVVAEGSTIEVIERGSVSVQIKWGEL